MKPTSIFFNCFSTMFDKSSFSIKEDKSANFSYNYKHDHNQKIKQSKLKKNRIIMSSRELYYIIKDGFPFLPKVPHVYGQIKSFSVGFIVSPNQCYIVKYRKPLQIFISLDKSYFFFLSIVAFQKTQSNVSIFSTLYMMASLQRYINKHFISQSIQQISHVQFLLR